MIAQLKSKGGYLIALAVMVLSLVWITFFNGDQHYVIISIMCLVASMLPFYWHFETRRSEAREIVFIAVLALWPHWAGWRWHRSQTSSQPASSSS